MIKLLFICGAPFAAWLILSQFIAWMLSSNKDDEEVMGLWACVFLAPALGLYLLLSYLQMRLERLMYASGLPIKKPSDNISDYIP